MTTYKAGNKIRLSVTFTDANGSLIDPATVSLKYQLPAGTATVTKVYPTDVVRDSLGAYHFDIDVTNVAGNVPYEWISTGTGQAAVVGEFTVEALPL